MQYFCCLKNYLNTAFLRKSIAIEYLQYSIAQLPWFGYGFDLSRFVYIQIFSILVNVKQSQADQDSYIFYRPYSRYVAGHKGTITIYS